MNAPSCTVHSISVVEAPQRRREMCEYQSVVLLAVDENVSRFHYEEVNEIKPQHLTWIMCDHYEVLSDASDECISAFIACLML